MDFEIILKSTILEALIEKIINIQNKNINIPAINAFTKIITDEPEAAATAVRLIICKMQSPNEWEALQTLNLLEACANSGCSSFQTEIGKFRFLNELIKLVSPKYLGNSTPAAIKNKIIDLLKQWSLKYPKETKIIEAFDMLVKQGVAVTPSGEYELGANMVSSRVTNSARPMYEDDDEKSKILQKLLRSNKPNDLKAANHLIKTMVKEKEEKEDLRLIANNTKLLSEMLSNISPDSSKEDIELMKELKETCVNMKPTLAFMISSSNKTTKESAELFELNDLLNDTIQLYHETMLGLRKPSITTRARIVESSAIQSSPPTLLDLSSPVDEVPLILPTNPVKSIANENKLQSSSLPITKVDSTVDTLEDIFNSSFGTIDGCKNDHEPSVVGNSESKPVNSTKLFQDLNALGKSLLETTAPTQCDVTKITLNDLATKSNGSVSETLGSASSDDQLLSEDDELMSGNDIVEEVQNMWKSTDAKSVLNSTPVINRRSEPKLNIEPLSDMLVPLIEIITEGNEKLTAFEDPNGICVYIQPTKNKPRRDVSVFLVLANSRRTESVTNFMFQPVVSKDCRLKLQPPSKCELSPFNPHIPIDTIVQIMLIASHDKAHIPLKFVISYNVQDEMVTEMGDVLSLPLR